MSLINRITQLAKSPQGKKLMTQAERVARDPKTKAKIQEARDRFEHKDRQPKPQTPGAPPAEKTPPNAGS